MGEGGDVLLNFHLILSFLDVNQTKTYIQGDV